MLEKISIDKKRLYIICSAMLVLLIAALFIPSSYSRLVGAAVLTALTTCVCILIKKRNIISFNKRQVLLITAVSAFTFLVLLYLSGLYFGFIKPAAPFNLENLLIVVIPIVIIIVTTEMTRCVLVAQESGFSTTASYLIGIVSELLVFSVGNVFLDVEIFVNILCVAFLPAISAGILFTYTAKKYGPLPSIAYRVLMAVYSYTLPFVPALPGVLLAISRLSLPLILLYFIDALYGKKEKKALKGNKIIGRTLTALVVIFIIGFVMMVSCRFKYCILVVGSESMSGEFEKGDAVVYERYDGEIITEGQIIVFQDSERLLVHRVVGIEKVDGQLRYYTKGDANESEDAGFITANNIIGTVNFKIAYIGYPSLWARSLFK